MSITGIETMTVDAFLADSVVVAESKLYVQGAGWNGIFSPAFPARHPRLGIGAIIHVPWTATNHMHSLEVRIEDADGHLLQLAPAREDATGPGIEDGALRRLRGDFNVGRPPMLQAGDEQVVPIAINLDGLEFPAPGTYRVVVSIDGTDLRHLPLRMNLVGRPVVTTQGR